MIIGILLLPGVVIGSLLTRPQPISPSQASIDVAIIGSEKAPVIKTALELDSASLSVTESSSLSTALTGSGVDTIVLIDTVLSASDVAALLAFLGGGGGLFILLGPEMSADGNGFLQLGITTDNNLQPSGDSARVVTRMVDVTHPLMTYDWASAPASEKITILPGLGSSTDILLANDTGFGTYGTPLLTHTEVGSGDIIVYTPWLTLNSTLEIPQLNHELVLWPYFNYFIYSTSVYIGDGSPYTYAEWAYSPVPHTEQQIIIGLIVFFIAIITSGAFISMRRKSRQQTKILTEIEKAELLIEVEEEVSDWEEIGMHRQVGGFLIQFFITLLILIPRVVLQIMIYPRYIMPFPTAAGWYSFSVNLFLGVWTVFDLGTSVALAKYFAEYRVSKPEEAIKYAQIFVWFQCLTGVVQITIVAFLGSILFPNTYLAHLSYVFIAHSLFQFPGFTLLFIHVFRGMNRIDAQQIVSILYYAVFNIVTPYFMIVVFRMWGAQNPVFGEALGGAIGQAAGMYFTEWLTFGVSLIMFKRLGFHPGTLFRVDFRGGQIKKALKFGAKWALGASSVPIVWMYQMVLVSTNLLNWSALQGQFQLAWDLAFMVQVVGLFMEGMLGGISESHSHGKTKLTELYTAQALRWGGFFAFWLISSLAAVGSRAILGAAGPSWSDAAYLLWFFLLFQTFGMWSWLGDWVFAGADRTGLAAIVWFIEQGSRAIFMTFFVLTEPVVLGIYLGGMPGIILGYVLGLILKDISAWILIRRTITAPKPYLWLSYIGPTIAALLNYIVLEIFSRLVWTNDIETSAILFLVATIPSLYIYSFFSGLTGTWDDETLAEFKRASEMVNIRGLGWLSRRFFGAVAIGAKVSPLHNRWKIDIYEEAMKEAEELTREKKQLVM